MLHITVLTTDICKEETEIVFIMFSLFSFLLPSVLKGRVINYPLKLKTKHIIQRICFVKVETITNTILRLE